MKRLFSINRQEPSFFWHKLLGFKPSDVSLYEKALRHRSLYPNLENNNERLEYLGDAVLHTIISEYLYKQNKHADEGKLTQIRTSFENRKNLNAIAHNIGLDQHIKSNTNVQGNDIAGNALEAIIGAIYLDKGIKTCEQFVIKNIIRKNPDNCCNNSKQELIQWCNANKYTLDFIILKNETIQDNRHNFLIAIHINGKEIVQASGNTKKEAERLAAAKALKITKKRTIQ